MATPVPPPIGAAPPVPSSLDPEATFDAQYEAFNAFERDVLVPGINAHTINVHANALAAETAAGNAGTAKQAAEQAAINAQNSANAASVAAGATEWVPGASYSQNDIVWGQTQLGVLYRCILAHSGITTQPENDTTRWVFVGSRVTVSPTAGPSAVTFTRTAGVITQIGFTQDGKPGTTTFTRSGGLLTQAVTAYDGKTRTEVFQRTANGVLTGITATET